MRVVAALLLCVSVAHADPAADRTKAREIAAEAMRKLQDAQDYATAADLFQRAYDLSPELPYLINVAVSLRKASLPQQSVAAYRRCLAEGGAALTPELRAQIEADIAHIIAESAQVNVHTAGAPAEIELDHRKVGTAAKDAPLLVLVATSGQRVLTMSASRAGYTPAEQRLEKLEPGKQIELELEPTPIPTTGHVTITSDPPQATLKIAARTGLAPQTWELPPGDYDIEARLPGHAVTHAPLQLRAGETRQLTVHLEATPPTWWEKHRWKVIVGSALVVGSAAAVGTYYLMKPDYGFTINYP